MRYEQSGHQGNSGSWLLSFILGGLVGAVVALLVAPKSGRQTGEQLRDMAQDVKEKAGGYYDQAKSNVADLAQKGSEVLHRR